MHLFNTLSYFLFFTVTTWFIVILTHLESFIVKFLKIARIWRLRRFARWRNPPDVAAIRHICFDVYYDWFDGDWSLSQSRGSPDDGYSPRYS